MWVVALEARTGRQLWLTRIPAGGAISCTAGRPAVTADRVVAMLITGEMRTWRCSPARWRTAT
jgi:hypothetical protein